MEKRKLKIIFSKSKQGTLSPRITIPSSWTKKLNITEEEREVNVYFINNQIIISKEEIKMDLELANKILIDAVSKEIESKKFICDSDLMDRVKKIIESLSNEEELEDNLDEYFDILVERANTFLKNNYKKVGKVTANGDYIGYFYSNSCYFETIEELEKFFNINEEF